MHVLTGEVAPLAPLLIPIGEIVVWAVALALCLLCVYLAKALFGTASSAVGWIPLFGKVVSRSLTSIEQKIVSFMSEAANAADVKMGAAFHQLARVVDWLGQEIARHANLIELLAGLIAGQAGIGLVASALQNMLHHANAAKAVANQALHKAVAVGHAVERGIGADVLPRIRTLDRELGRVIGLDIPGIRAGERTLWRGLDDLRKWVKTHALAAGTLATTGAVAWALARLGAGWIRCGNWNRLGRGICRAPSSLIDDILGLIVDVLLVENICQVIPLLEEGFSIVAAPLVTTLTEVGAGLCELGSSPPATLAVPPLYLPATVDDSLYLAA